MRCGNRSATFSEVEEEVTKALRRLSADIRDILEGKSTDSYDSNTAITAILQKELNALETQQERLYEFLEQGVYTSEVFVRRNAALAKKRKELEQAIDEAKAKEVTVIDYKKRYIALLEAIAVLEDRAASASEKNRLLRAVVKDMIYHRETDIRDKWHPVPFRIEIVLV